MRILPVFPILITTCIVLIAAEKKELDNDNWLVRCKQYNTPGIVSQFKNNVTKRPFTEFYEKGIPLLFIPSCFIYYDDATPDRNCKE